MKDPSATVAEDTRITIELVLIVLVLSATQDSPVRIAPRERVAAGRVVDHVDGSVYRQLPAHPNIVSRRCPWRTAVAGSRYLHRWSPRTVGGLVWGRCAGRSPLRSAPFRALHMIMFAEQSYALSTTIL